MAAKDWLIGTLRPDGYLMTESGKILLTTLPKGATQPPEAATLPVAEEDLSKTALVGGDLVGGVLYSGAWGTGLTNWTYYYDMDADVILQRGETCHDKPELMPARLA